MVLIWRSLVRLPTASFSSNVPNRVVKARLNYAQVNPTIVCSIQLNQGTVSPLRWPIAEDNKSASDNPVRRRYCSYKKIHPVGLSPWKIGKSSHMLQACMRVLPMRSVGSRGGCVAITIWGAEVPTVNISTCLWSVVGCFPFRNWLNCWRMFHEFL